MKNLIYILLITFFSTTFSYAQVVVGVNTSVNFATSNLEYAKTGIGFNATGLYKYKHFGIGANAGYINFWEKYAYTVPYNTGGEGISYKSFSITNITGKLNYFVLTKKIKPYVGIDLGAYIMRTTHRVLENNSGYNSATYQFTETYAGFSPSIGVLWTLNPRVDLQTQATYSCFYATNTIPNSLKYDWYSFSLGIVYCLKKPMYICGTGANSTKKI